MNDNAVAHSTSKQGNHRMFEDQGLPRVLEVQGVSKSFGGNHVLRGVNFEVRPGEVHALLGENGAGKSTLTKIIGGVHHADGGRVLYKGDEVSFRDPGSAVSAGISTVYQELNLLPNLDCASNICLGREHSTALFAHQGQMRAEAAKALEEIGSRATPTTMVSSLSTGERQLVEIAKALASDASLVIMDEPTAALSTGEVEKLHKSVRRLTARGISVIYISHKLDEVFEISDRLSVMRDGRLLATLDSEEFDRDKVVSLMLGRELEKEFRVLEAEQDPTARRTGTPALKVEDLTVPGKIHGVSMRVLPGEILGLAGLVGAGRTETVRALVGLEKVSGGSIEVDGRPYKPRSPRKAIKNGLVLVPEDRKTQGLVLGASVEDNIALPHLERQSWGPWIRRRAVRRMVKKCVDDFDVRPRDVDKIATFLSGGNQQKVMIGRWLVEQYKVLIFDEPSKGVDVGARAGIWQMIRETADQGAAVIVISSETEELLALAQRILVMREGRITKELYNNQLTQDEVMKHAF